MIFTKNMFVFPVFLIPNWFLCVYYVPCSFHTTENTYTCVKLLDAHIITLPEIKPMLQNDVNKSEPKPNTYLWNSFLPARPLGLSTSLPPSSRGIPRSLSRHDGLKWSSPANSYPSALLGLTDSVLDRIPLPNN